jgi:hypothetical protein
MKWFKNHKVITVILVLIVLIAIGGASNSGKGNTTINNTPSNTNSSQASNKQNSKSVAHVGSTLSIGGNKGLAVTAKQIIDPANGANEFTSADAGKRFVAVVLSLKNNGSGSYTDDANNNLSIKGSDNQTYSPSFDSLNGCTNFNNGQYTLTAGDSVDGCVAFQVPNGVNVAKIQFQTVSGLNSSTGEWVNP